MLGTDYEDYAINNSFISDNSDFIERKTGTSKFSFAFIYENETFGVWVDYTHGKIFVSTDYVSSSPMIFSTTIDNHKSNTLFLKSASNYSCWKQFIDNFKLGNVYFENMKIKNICYLLIKQLLTR